MRRRKELEIRPVLPESVERYTVEWRDVQARFVDQPSQAVKDADRLVTRLMEERGYPTADFEQRVADISVDHPRVVDNYRGGHAVWVSNEQGKAGTEDLRQAMIHYRSLFEELLAPEEAPEREASEERAALEEREAQEEPETPEEHDALFRIMLKKGGITTTAQSITEVTDDASGLSGADIEAILARAVLAADAASGNGDPEVPVEMLRRAFADFIPATSPLERELQILVAVQECTSREVLPEMYRSMDRETVLSRINELKALLNT